MNSMSSGCAATASAMSLLMVEFVLLLSFDGFSRKQVRRDHLHCLRRSVAQMPGAKLPRGLAGKFAEDLVEIIGTRKSERSADQVGFGIGRQDHLLRLLDPATVDLIDDAAVEANTKSARQRAVAHAHMTGDLR